MLQTEVQKEMSTATKEKPIHDVVADAEPKKESLPGPHLKNRPLRSKTMYPRSTFVYGGIRYEMTRSGAVYHMAASGMRRMKNIEVELAVLTKAERDEQATKAD